MLLLQKELTLHPAESKTNLNFGFTVQKPMKKLHIHFSYSPKKLEDREKSRQYIEEGLRKFAPEPYTSGYGSWEDYLPLVNLVTLSLDDENGYRGCAHRHTPEQQHIISKDFTSPGFYKGEITLGDWQAVINIHAVVSDDCRVLLTIEGVEE